MKGKAPIKAVREVLMQRGLSFHVSRLRESGECVRLSLTSVILKKNRHDLRYLDAVVSERDENGFVILQAFKDIKRFLIMALPS